MTDTLPTDRTALENAAPALAPADSRRNVIRAGLAGAAGLLLGAIGRPGVADAAAGGPMLLGKANSAGTAATSLATKATGTGLTVAQTGTGAGLKAGSTTGVAVLAVSTGNNGVSAATASGTKTGLYAVNNAAATGTGSAIRADGKQNHGVVASSAAGATHAVRAINTVGSAIRALGGGSVDGDITTFPGYSPSVLSAGQFAAPGNGVTGIATTAGGKGVIGYADAGVGVFAVSTSSYGLWGMSETDYGVYGYSTSGIGIFGYSYSNHAIKGVSDWGNGVYGVTNATNATGVYAEATVGTSYAVYSKGKAGVQGLLSVTGNVTITGSITKGSGTFRIDHPLDPANKYLSHSFVESPDMKNVYDGVVTLDADGGANVELPEWFEALNRDHRFQLTPMGAAMPELHVGAGIRDGRFSIAGGKAGHTVCWQVTGIRQDAFAVAHPTPVEEAKTGEEIGRFLHPVEHGRPEHDGLDHIPGRRPSAEALGKDAPAKPKA